MTVTDCTGIPQQEGGGAVPQESGSDSAAGAVSASGIALIAVFPCLSAAAVVAQMLFSILQHCLMSD